MSVTTDIIEMLQRGQLDEKLFDIYVDETQIDYQRKRYVNAINEYEMVFGTEEIEIFSAPGRSEIAGNHMVDFAEVHASQAHTCDGLVAVGLAAAFPINLLISVR